MKDHIMRLVKTMYEKLNEISTKEGNTLQIVAKKVAVISAVISELKSFILGYSFVSREEEILFFKTYEPRLYSQLLFYKHLLELETYCPFSREEKKVYYEKELQRVNIFLHRKIHWVTYYRTNATYLDEKYFLRNGSNNDPILSSHIFTSDTRFCTIGSINFSRIQCSKKLVKEIEQRLAALEGKDTPDCDESPGFDLRWTASKTDAIEFLYWLHSSDAINDGRVDVKQIARWLEQSLGIDLGNYYRVIQGIRIRKNRTQFTDHATRKFIRRMDQQDENPRY